MRLRRLVDYLNLLRVHQYVKNAFIFLPLFFAGELLVLDSLFQNLRAFVAFSLVASSIYIFNDLVDLQEDQEHPSKRLRPLASGVISKSAARLAMGFLVIFGLGLSIYWFPFDFLAFMVFYLAISILYSLKLKQVPLVDLIIIAVGFVVRLFIGSVSASVPLTVWIITMTFLLALLLGFSKRRDDLLTYSRDQKERRKRFDGYTLEFANAGMVIMAGAMIVSYMMYTISPETISKFGTDKLYLTTIFVLYGTLRYLQLSFAEESSGSPTQIVLKDGFLQTTIFLWLLSFSVLLYLRR